MSILFFGIKSIAQNKKTLTSKLYYFSPSGNDKNAGTKESPLKTIEKFNTINLNPGDAVFFEGGKTFNGTLQVNFKDAGNAADPLLISSYGSGSAIINGGDSSAINIFNTNYISVKTLKLMGAGRKKGNIKDGISINNCKHILIDSLDIAGFQKAGLLVYSSSEVSIAHIHAYENGYAGISVESEYGKRNSKHINISDCLTENNPGDPSNLNNHSGNGIVVGNSNDVTIEYCVAANNGWDMPRIGNGPVGIWCYEASRVNIQSCISHDNKTAKGADDGGGFDLDGGVTYSVIQHCLSYNNQGSAFGIFQYSGASPWHDNTIRDNISENDGAVSAAHAAAYIWNSTGDTAQFKNLSFNNNILYNSKGAAIHYANGQDNRKAFSFHNNIFVAKDELINGHVSGDIFSGNTWWSIVNKFNIDSINDFKAWALRTGKEQNNGKITGKNIDPNFKNAGHTTLTNPHKITLFITNYKRKIG